MNLIITLLIISFIVFFHEAGHFIFAKLNKIDVVEFSIGMGPRIFSFKIGETKYSIKALPLGGSCAMQGMLEDMDENEELTENSFINKGKVARASVILAGPFFNFVLAFLLSLIIIFARGYNVPIINDIVQGGAAQNSELKKGDIIQSINGRKIHNSASVSYSLIDYDGKKKIDIKILRNGQKNIIKLTPKYDRKSQRYMIGVVMSYDRIHGNLIDNIRHAYYETEFFVESTITSLKLLITGKVSVNNLLGPIGVSSVVGSAIHNGGKSSDAIFNLMNLSALISANLGIINLLPIPAFDGGRFLLILLEAIRRKRLNPKIEENIIVAGFVLLIGLSVLVFFNDIVRLFK